jgi:hypothetical protein
LTKYINTKIKLNKKAKKSHLGKANLERVLDEQQVFHYDFDDYAVVRELETSVINSQCSHEVNRLL